MSPNLHTIGNTADGSAVSVMGEGTTPECLNYSVFPQNVKLVFLLLLVVAAEKKGWASNREMFVIEVERRTTQPHTVIPVTQSGHP